MTGPPPKFAALLRARRGFLATTDGSPHVVPVCFTWAGDIIWTAVDAKPKSSSPLQRIKDIEQNPEICFVVDRWDEDWSKLSWLQARGTARILAEGPQSEKAYSALRDKYEQYRETPLDGPVIQIEVSRWLGWPR